MQPQWDGTEIAIIGMSGRFPGASDLNAFWHNLRDGVESIRHFSDDELRASGVGQEQINNPDYVKAAAFLDAPEEFAASFFDMSHREAAITDPQHRILLECAWTVLESAGYDPARFHGPIGVYAGATINTYLLFNLATNPQAIDDLAHLQLNVGNAGDFLATRIAYKLNLKGPSYTIQSACSTSLVAVHVACESLLNQECDMALAGGVSINLSFRHGYRYLEGGITSPDGRCRPFDAQAQGTIFGSGVGVVLLKRLADAQNDNDTIHAIIRGSAVNNDGSLKIGYTAPSVEGQAQVIAEALANAGVDASTISYVETHGTATHLGDPVEIRALTKAFRMYTEATHFCGIGSVKGNIGHLDAAAGIAGLIKTILALKHRQIPPTLHFERPNPNIDFASTPFYVNHTLTDWHPNHGPRRAGISAFGVGGTNAHVVVEEAPPAQTTPSSRPFHLLLLAAKTSTALAQMTTGLATHLQSHPDLNLADVAFTLQVGRRRFSHRRFVVAQDTADATFALNDPERTLTARRKEETVRSVAFMFTGQGAQYVNMGRDLYDQESVFRQEVDRCAAILQQDLDFDLRNVLYPEMGNEREAGERLKQTAVTQPALFVVEYALAQLWLSWGIRPQALVGHSIGEYVAACLAGVFTLEEALSLVAARGRLMQTLPGGAMLAVPLSEFEIQSFLQDGLAIAAINGPGRCVISGSHTAIAQIKQQLSQDGVSGRLLHTSHAFHSPVMAQIADQFRAQFQNIQLRSPQIPFLSNVSGTWITEEQATAPAYWANHLHHTVQFAGNLAELLADGNRVLLEVGPAEMLCRLARRHPDWLPEHVIIPTLRHPQDHQNDLAVAFTAVGKLWLAGIEPDWDSLYGHEQRQRLPLPTYPFERQRCWIEPTSSVDISTTTAPPPERASTKDWFYLPTWQQVLPPRLDRSQLAAQPRHWLLFGREQHIAPGLVQELRSMGQPVVTVSPGPAFRHDHGHYTLNPGHKDDYKLLVQTLYENNQWPDTVVHLWNMTATATAVTFENAQTHGYYSLLYLVQALVNTDSTRACDILLVTNQAAAITAHEELYPEKATVWGACKVISQEHDPIRCQVMDIAAPSKAALRDQILATATNWPTGPIAYRGLQCWKQIYHPMPIPPATTLPWRKNGVYLLTGGLIEMGVDIARHLVQQHQARLVMIEEGPLPPQSEWEQWLATHKAGDATSQRISNARMLAELGSDVFVLAVDLNDATQVQQAVAQAIAHFGEIHGVIHNARVLGERSFRTVLDTDTTESKWQFVPKVHGLINLAQALHEQSLDFFVLNSSLSSILGGLGMVAYAAANNFMDAFARQQQRRQGGVWISINWDAWENTQLSAMSADWAELALSPAEATAVLDRVLGVTNVEQIIVSTSDLSKRIAQWQQKRLAAANKTGHNGSLHPRPDLPTAYVAPGNEREQIVAEIWQKTLGVAPVGVLDNFFELGGDSLLAIQMVPRLKQALQTDVPVVSLYEGLTIRSLVNSLEESDQQAAQAAAKRKAHVTKRRQMLQQQRNRRRRHTLNQE